MEAVGVVSERNGYDQNKEYKQESGRGMKETAHEKRACLHLEGKQWRVDCIPTSFSKSREIK
tara:strand:+ start:504 stop:689 length:186 start_codon:yes stop_codon:yes gene_type:complete